MTRYLAAGLLVLAACGAGSDGGGITPPPPVPKKPDPYITIRVRDLMDTTTLDGRAHWHMWVVLTGATNENLNGILYQGNIGLNDMELSHNVRCIAVAADSVGQRLVTIVAFADTTTDQLTPDATAESIANAWYAGNHVLPNGWAVLTFPPTDAWQSAQYVAGHGLIKSDPIKWGFDWTGAGVATFSERTDNDPQCSTV
jgi:hypothetical protein